MCAMGNDVWNAAFLVDKLGAWRFTLLGWVDHFATWAGELKKRIAAQEAAEIADAAPDTIPGPDAGLNVGPNFNAQDIALSLRPELR